MAKLCQIIALVDGQKPRTREAVTKFHRELGQDGRMTGLARRYRPLDDEGEQLPPEHKIVQIRAGETFQEACASWKKLWDLVLTLDSSNQVAAADVVVDGNVLIPDVPVTSLLFLQKQLVDFHTFVSKIPVLDPAYEWEFSADANCYATKPVEAARTKKIPRNHVKAEATANHPAQVDVYPEDVVVGYWSKTDFSGAMSARDRQVLLDRVVKVQDAVKVAREEANARDATDRSGVTETVFNYLQGDIT